MADFMHSPLAKFLKKNGICPVCNVKKIIAATKITADGADTLCNGAALTPPMGWASWNSFRRNINESIIIETAKAMQAAGLDKLGYTYVNIDDCWMSSMRDKDGKLQGDLAAFPSGMKSLVQKINACGFKAGIYTSNGTAANPEWQTVPVRICPLPSGMSAQMPKPLPTGALNISNTIFVIMCPFPPRPPK